MLRNPAGFGGVDYFPCRYGTSRAEFRGPPRDLTQPYIAMLGGTATFGKHVAAPYPALVEQALARPVANLGALAAGPDFYLSDPAALAIAAHAQVAVVQPSGAEGLSNPFYRVHARRNDRFLAPTPALRALFPKVDLADIHFTRHLLQVLHHADPLRFLVVQKALQDTWLVRMRQLLTHLPPRRVLLWLAEGPPPDTAKDPGSGLILSRTMLEALGPEITDLVKVTISGPTLAGMRPTENAACAADPSGAGSHAAVSAALLPVLSRLVQA